MITDAFGTHAEMDAFNAANRVAELLFNLVAGGALASAFIPTFTGFLAQRRPRRRLAAGFVGDQPGAAHPDRGQRSGSRLRPADRECGLFLLAPGSLPDPAKKP